MLECDTPTTHGDAYSRHVDGVTAAMDEQAQATGAILASMQQAADGVSRISTGLDDWTIGMEERRTARRTRVLLRAAIQLPDDARIACSIRDLTGGGAQLQLGQPAQVPDRFSVVVAADGAGSTVPCGIAPAPA